MAAFHVETHNKCGSPVDASHKRLEIMLRDCRMTGSELARRCRVHENTVTNWRTGRSPVPGAVFAYLELLAKVKAIVA